jgi:beta-glucanase (GH16 family)
MNFFLKYLLIGLMLINFAFDLHAQFNTGTDKAYKPNWRLVFSDEFDSLGLNPQKWSNRFPWGRWTHGLHYNTDGQNLMFNGTALTIKIDDDSLTEMIDKWDSLGNYIPYLKHFDYTSGMIYSKRNFKYGYFETKVKIPACKGLNAAFWLYGPNSCEIDVFEIQGSTPNNAQMTLHWKDLDSITNSRQSIYHSFSIDSNFSQKEYTFGLKWKYNELVWYIDNNEIVEDFYTRMTRSRHIPNVDMNAIFTCEVGTMDGPLDSTSVFPANYKIDYFRAYSDDTVPPPFITGQMPVSMSFFSSLAIVPNMLMVADFFHNYPAGFKVKVMSGADYILNGNIITPLHNYIDTLYVPVKVNDGIDDSPVFNLMVVVPDANFIMENEHNKNLILFPNPANNYLKIELKSTDEMINGIDVFDTKGVSYIHNWINIQKELEISHLLKGMYFIAITTNKGKRILKFVKQ